MGEIKDQLGLIIEGENYKVVKKAGEAFSKIPRHNHPEANITFTIVKGKVAVRINSGDSRILNPGQILHFDGSNYLEAEFLEAGEVFVTLIMK